MRSAIACAGLVIGLFAAGVPAALGDDEDSIPLDKVPAAVKQAAAKAVPGATWTKAGKETEDGKTIYEIEGKTAKGLAVTVSVSTDAKVLEVETVIAATAVPKVVSDALKAKVAGFMATLIETVEKDGKLASYEFHGKKADGKKAEVVISPDGKKVEVEDSDEG